MQSSRTTKAHPRRGAVVGLLFCVLVFLLSSSIASGYRPPNMNNNNNMNTNAGQETKDATTHRFLDSNNVHVVATQWAIDLLEADGQSFEAHATLKKNFDVLVQGLREAETSGGEFSLKTRINADGSDDSEQDAAYSFHRNVFGHFVDATTQEDRHPNPQGLELSDEAIDEEALSKVLPVAGIKESNDNDGGNNGNKNNKWKLDAAKGPNIALTDLIDWHYALAVEHMKQGELREAILNLGYVAHFVQDATVPQRVSRDAWLRSESHLIEYEQECEELLLKSEILPPTEGGIYKTASDWKPHDYVAFAAASAQRFAKAFVEAPAFNKTLASIAANELVPLSAKLTAGLFIRFFYGWYTERFTLIVLSIDQVKATLEKSTASSSLYPTAIIGDDALTSEQRRSSISHDNSDNEEEQVTINPNEGFAAYGWVWTRWVDKNDYNEAVKRYNVKETLSEQEDDYDVIDEPWIPITINLWNKGSSSSSSQVDISPDAADKTLKLRYGLKSGHIWLCYHLYPNPSVNPTLKKLQTNRTETSEHSFFDLLKKKTQQVYDHFSFVVEGDAQEVDSAKLQLSIARFPKVQTGLTIGKKLGLMTAVATSLSMALIALVVIVYTRRKEAAAAEANSNDWNLVPSSASTSSSSSSLTDANEVWPQNLFTIDSERDLLIEDLQEQDPAQFNNQYYIV